MERTDSGLWVANIIPLLKHRRRVKTVTLPDGEKVKRVLEDGAKVVHTHRADDTIDGAAYPDPIRIRIRTEHQ